jgi:hypothetical protein
MKVDRQIFIKEKLFHFRADVMKKILLGVTGVRAEMFFRPNGAKSFSPALTDDIGLRWVTGGTATTLKELHPDRNGIRFYSFRVGNCWTPTRRSRFSPVRLGPSTPG